IHMYATSIPGGDPGQGYSHLRDLVITSDSTTDYAVFLDGTTYMIVGVRFENVTFLKCAAGAVTTGTSSIFIEIDFESCNFWFCCQPSSNPVVNLVGTSATTVRFRRAYFSDNYNNAAGL